MSEIDDINDAIDDIQNAQGDDENTLDDHDQRIGDQETLTQDLDPNRINQLNFPLDQQTIDLILSVFPTGVVKLSGGTGSITDNRLQNNTANPSIVLYSVIISSVGSVIAVGNPFLNYSYTISGSTLTFNSTISTDGSTLGYVIINPQI